MRDIRSQLLVSKSDKGLNFAVDYSRVTERDEKGKATAVEHIGRGSATVATFDEHPEPVFHSRGVQGLKAAQRAANNIEKRSKLLVDAEALIGRDLGLSTEEKAVVGLMQVGNRIKFVDSL